MPFAKFQAQSICLGAATLQDLVSWHSSSFFALMLEDSEVYTNTHYLFAIQRSFIQVTKDPL